MGLREPPQVLRIKRKRTDDPLQALVFEESKRQIKRPKFVFKLQRTEENDIQDSTTVLNANESSNNRTNNRPVFNLPKLSANDLNNDTNQLAQNFNDNIGNDVKPLDDGPQELNPDLLDMLNDYLKNNDETKPTQPVKPPKRRQSSVSQKSEGRPQNLIDISNMRSLDEATVDDGDDDEYVYDVYYRDLAISNQLETENIGYIKFDDDDMDLIEEDENSMMVTDDEDSNDENFYRNDYPDDEDGGYDESEVASLGLEEPSDDQDDEFDILTNKRRFSRVDFKQTEGLNNLSGDEMDGIEDRVLERPDPWKRIEREAMGEDAIMEGNEDDIDMDGGDVGFKRNIFFKSDNEDPMAIHRDRIFGKLQNMINE